MVSSWVTYNLPLFQEQFACVGIRDETKKPGPEQSLPEEGESKTCGALIEQHSYNLFKFYATGRLNCQYCLVTVETKRRQDMLTMTTFNLLWPELDRVSYEIPLAFSERYPCIFAVVKRREMKNILENNKLLVSISDYQYRKITLLNTRLKGYPKNSRY